MKKINGIAILGPTGSGKTSIAIELAKRLNGEIISCDSMQIYKGMPIGTAQPTANERTEAQYHLVDFLDISEPYNASMFTKMASEKIAEIQQGNHFPIFAGGTGMYANFLFYGHDNFPSNKAVFNELLNRYENGEFEQLSKELKEIDEKAWLSSNHNWRRLLRALEICKVTGKKLSESTSNFVAPAEGFKQFVLLFSPEKMRERIAIRTRQMVEEGWIEEAELLFEKGLMETPTAKQALGYSLIHEYLFPTPKANNEKHMAIPTKEVLIEKLITKTAQYAKKQRTWFRNKHKDAVFIEMDELTVDEAVEQICKHLDEK